jgi:hypothetical protein
LIKLFKEPSVAGDNVGMKRCTICGKSKPHSDFHRQASRSDGYANWCKPCKSERKRMDYANNKQATIERVAGYRAKHPDRVAATKRRCYEAKKEQYLDRCRERYRANRERVLEVCAEYRRKNKAQKARWERKYVRERMQVDPLFRMTYAVRNRIFYAMRRKGYTKQSRTREIIGCDWEQLSAHIEGQFLDGMTWDNYGEWHIDHIVPLASASTAQEMEALCHYRNLRPLWAGDNIRKGAKLAA